MRLMDFFLPLMCLIGFTAHCIVNIIMDMNTRRTTSIFSAKNFSSMETPFVIEISVSPAFRTDELREYGYGQALYYFTGIDPHGNMLGWSEKDNKNFTKNAKDVFLELTTVKNLNEVIENIAIFDTKGEKGKEITVDIPLKPKVFSNSFVIDPSEIFDNNGDIQYLSFLPKYRENLTLTFTLIDRVFLCKNKPD